MSNLSDDTYDVNFCFPVREMENDRIKLTPFIPAVHGELYFQGSKDHPEIYDFLPFGPFATCKDFIVPVMNNRVQPNPGIIVFAILDKTTLNKESGEPAFAGMIELLNTEPQHLSTELGFAITLLPFQRTHVTTNAMGLMLMWCLDPPKNGGLGLRRVQWQTNMLNEASKRSAERMGFKMECVVRWERALPPGKEGLPWGSSIVGEDGKVQYPGRHTAVLALCWDDWEVEREKIIKEMERR